MSKLLAPTQAKRKQPDLFSFKHGEMLDAINEYFLLTGQQITRLLYPKDKNGNYTAKSGNYTTVATRLKYLVEGKFIHAHHLPTDEGQRPYVYSLARRGRQYEEEQGREVLIYWEKEEIQSRSPGWKMHLLELNDFLITTRLLSVFDPTLTIARVTHDLLLKKKPYEYLDNGGTCYTIQPDAVIELHQEREGKNRLRYIIFVEMDRGNNSNVKFRTHLGHLYNYVARGQAEADFGTSNIVVVFPTTAGDRRVEHMRHLVRLEFGDEVKESWRRNRMFLFTTVPELQQPQPGPIELYETSRWYSAYGHERKVQIVEPAN